VNIALITARGGSKGLPRKNILSLCGKPLIAWTINAAKRSKNIDYIYVSTEDDEIAAISKECGAEVIPRPMNLAEDTSSSEPVIEHSINYLMKKNIDVQNICLLQPTSPLRTHEQIDKAFDIYFHKKANCVVSVFEPKHTPVKAYKLESDGSIIGLLNDNAPYDRRQDLPIAFQPNGAIYIFSSSNFLVNAQIPRTYVFPFLMSEAESADIDTLADFNEVETIIKSKYYE
jgi:CMP-N-acetylneuraminic acid synthetase